MNKKLVPHILLLICIPQYAQCLNAVVKDFLPCDADTSKYLGWASYDHIKPLGNYVYAVNMNMTLSKDVDENTIYSATVYKGKRKLPISYQGKNACKTLMTVFNEYFVSILKQLGRDTTCPAALKAGSAYNMPVVLDTKLIRMQFPLKGEFKVRITAHEPVTNKLYSCLEFVAEL